MSPAGKARSNAGRTRGGYLSGRDAWLLLATLAALILLNVPVLGLDGWTFHTGPVHAKGLFAPLVSAASGRWDLGLLRSIAVLAGLLVLAAAAAVLARGRIRVSLAAGCAVVVVAALLLPAVALQAGLRQSTAPWFYTNDSTYQIEIAGKLLRDGTNPYGHDYSSSGLERFYSLDGTVAPRTNTRQVALHHLAYFPGTPLVAAAWGALPEPISDFRILVALCSLLLLPAALLFRGPLGTRLALGSLLAANPLIVHGAWFGTADAVSLLLLVGAFGFASRSRLSTAAALLAGAVLAKQFALVAVPFFAVMLLARTEWRRLGRPAAWFAGVLLAGFVPFLVAGPGALWADTVHYGAGTYRIIGYGLAALLLRAHVLHSRTGYYPFVPLALIVWLPVTAWLLWLQRRARSAWVGAAGFSLSIFLLLFLARVFQTSYLAWPLAAGALALLLHGAEQVQEAEEPVAQETAQEPAIAAGAMDL
jgi:hypothetical protein